MQNGNRLVIIALMAMLAFSSLAFAQTAQQDNDASWKICPRCQSPQQRTEAWAKNEVDSRPFNGRKLSGIWGWDGVAGAFNQRTRPPLTPWGKQQYDAKGVYAPPDRNSPEFKGC